MNPPALLPWATALSHGIALFAVLVLSSLSWFVGRMLVREGSGGAVLIGPIAGVSAVATDWIFLLLTVTPIRW